jgi:hypothetical protein
MDTGIERPAGMCEASGFFALDKRGHERNEEERNNSNHRHEQETIGVTEDLDLL